jgi:HK97 family phage prohead protease
MNLATDRTEIVRRSEFRVSDDSDGQTLEGYAAVFNAWTGIRDSMGVYQERIAPGAFKRSIGQRTPVLQFEHGNHPLLGSLPLGAITVLREDKNGLFVRARLSDNWLIQPVRDAIRDGGIDGMSFRFRVVADEWDDAKEHRTIKEVELLELGPVVFPAYEQTSVAVRSLVGALDDETRAELARELVTALAPTDAVEDDGEARDETVTDTAPAHDVTPETGDDVDTESGTSPVAGEPAEDDGPDEPPVASHNNRHQIAEALSRYRQTTRKGQ